MVHWMQKGETCQMCLSWIIKVIFCCVCWRPAVELSEHGVSNNSQSSAAGPSTDSSPSSADDPPSSLQQVSSAGGHRPTSTNANDSSANNSNVGGRNSQRRRSTRHQNYLNRSQLHQAVDLPEGYGLYTVYWHRRSQLLSSNILLCI